MKQRTNASTVDPSLRTPPSLYSEFRQELITLLEGSDDFSTSYQREALESKLLDPAFADPAELRERRAIVKWLRCEKRNRKTNFELAFCQDEEIPGLPGIEFEAALDYARKIVLSVVGEVPDMDLLRGSHSNGASTGVRREPGSVGSKYMVGRDITERCVWVFEKLNVSETWRPEYNIVPGNILFTVSKSREINRCAAKEPELNMYCQKAIGDFIRRRLMKVGVNLNDQTINQELALAGSITDDLATVDLSSASDSVTTQLVFELLPPAWSSLLMDVRSPHTLVRIAGQNYWHENQMVSSMGNACTFELESLIFYALTRTACYLSGSKGRVSVYGDDIICPSKACEVLEALLGFCGFTFNRSKSFVNGPFRESCGKHYWNGRDVTPFYIRKVPVDVSEWIHLLNKMRAWLHRLAILDILDGEYYPLWKKYSELVPAPARGGYDYGRRDILVSPGRRPLARVALSKRSLTKKERTLAPGLLLYWLDTADRLAEDRHDPSPATMREMVVGRIFARIAIRQAKPPLVTSSVEVESKEWTLSRLRHSKTWAWSTCEARFPQEWGILV